MKCCTLATLSHIHRAKVMATSWRTYYPEAQLILCLVEQTDCLDEDTRRYFDDVVLAKDLGIADFLTIMFGYEAAEATCSLKAELLRYMLRKYPEEQHIFYLDSDIKLYSRLLEAEQAIEKHNLVLTPHLLNFPPQVYINFFGVFNTGFLAIRRSEQIEMCLDWWKEKLRFHCYIHHDRGVFLDQTWLNAVPGFVDTYICHHPGYNVSFWNLHEGLRQFSSIETCHDLASGFPLRFIHFSRLTDDFATIVNESHRDPSGVIRHHFQAYMRELEHAGRHDTAQIPWSYDFYYDGTKIDRKTKENFRREAEVKCPSEDPFLGCAMASKQRASGPTSSSNESLAAQEQPLIIVREAQGKKKTWCKKRKTQPFMLKRKSRKTRRSAIIRRSKPKRRTS